MAKMNIPNRLTIIRILLVPVVVAVFLCMDPTIGVIDEASGLALRDVIAFVIFAVASITDFFDGMLARKNNWITSFGKFADPIADKMLVNTVLILMVYFHQANVIAVLLMIARDLIVDGLRMSAANSGEVVSAGIFGYFFAKRDCNGVTENNRSKPLNAVASILCPFRFRARRR